MRKIVTLLFLLTGVATAAAPEYAVAPLCLDGEMRGVVIRVPGAGTHQIKWPKDICTRGDA